MGGLQRDDDIITDNYRSSIEDNSGEYSCTYTPQRSNVGIRKSPGAWMVAIILSAVIILLIGMVMGVLAMEKLFEYYNRGSDIVENGNSGYANENNTLDDAETLRQGEITPISTDHGIRTIDVTDQNLFMLRQYGISEPGVIVIGSEYSDELIIGDRIIMVNGDSVECTNDINRAIDGMAAGQTVEFIVVRNSQIFRIRVSLYEQMPSSIDF